jgi:2-polyprenyl-3-methyl-5-hydroxy-6-metoxy-1,4-benzoquinol methylase
MSGCCSARGVDEFFTENVARRDARRYRRRGLDANAQRVVSFVRREGVDGRTVLEVGGGVGAIQLELLRAGAAASVNVELSAAYEPYAAQLADEAGLGGRTERRVLDFAMQGDEIAAADVVVLHKVVCCYPDYETLVGAAAGHAKHELALTFPRDVMWMRLGLAVINLLQRMRRRSFRVYLHPPAAVLAVANAHGLEPASRHRGLVWEFAGLTRRVDDAALAAGSTSARGLAVDESRGGGLRPVDRVERPEDRRLDDRSVDEDSERDSE